LTRACSPPGRLNQNRNRATKVTPHILVFKFFMCTCCSVVEPEPEP
jgi:hypothetical protein